MLGNLRVPLAPRGDPRPIRSPEAPSFSSLISSRCSSIDLMAGMRSARPTARASSCAHSTIQRRGLRSRTSPAGGGGRGAAGKVPCASKTPGAERRKASHPAAQLSDGPCGWRVPRKTLAIAAQFRQPSCGLEARMLSACPAGPPVCSVIYRIAYRLSDIPWSWRRWPWRREAAARPRAPASASCR